MADLQSNTWQDSSTAAVTRHQSAVCGPPAVCEPWPLPKRKACKSAVLLHPRMLLVEQIGATSQVTTVTVSQTQAQYSISRQFGSRCRAHLHEGRLA
jgi:hypothetical protein